MVEELELEDISIEISKLKNKEKKEKKNTLRISNNCRTSTKGIIYM